MHKQKYSHEEIPHPWALGNLGLSAHGLLLELTVCYKQPSCECSMVNKQTWPPLQSSNMYIDIYTLLFKNETNFQ